MKEYIFLSIYIYITKKKKTTASEIAEHFEISKRTVYRYINSLVVAGVPVYTVVGKNGGVFLEEEYKLESIVFTADERCVIEQALKKYYDLTQCEGAKKLISCFS